MKKRIATVFAISALLFSFVPSVALAVDATTNQSAAQTTTATDTATDIKARIEKRKAEVKARLTNTQKNKIMAKCKAGQDVIGNVKGKLESAEAKRGEAYNNAVTNLTNLSEKLKNKGIDTSTLDANIITLKEKIATFTTDLATYKQVVSDLKDMDCVADPDGFNASLQAARTALGNVNKDSTDIRSYIKDTIKPLLVTLRAELAPKPNTTGGGQ